MDKNTLLLIFVLFLLSSQLWSITWNIGVSAFYIIIIIIVLNYVNPDSSIAMRSTIIRIINLKTGEDLGPPRLCSTGHAGGLA